MYTGSEELSRCTSPRCWPAIEDEAVTNYAKFLPENIPEWQMPFWDSLRRRQMAVQRCGECGTFRYIPKELCPTCLSRESSWAEVSGRGEVYTYSVVHRAPTPAYQADVPYVIAHVTMDEGFRMVSNVSGLQPDALYIGMRVQLVYIDATPEWTLFGFVPGHD
jgi:uncharacterized protein